MTRILSEKARDTYRRISGTDEAFSVAYRSSVREEDGMEEALCRLYRENREDDIRLGVTSAGPHRDDLVLSLNDHPMKLFASQGQIRTGALSLKLSQMDILKELSGEDPVLLLDDVLSELDAGRQDFVVNCIRSGQVLITCCETDRVTAAGRTFRIESGTVRPVED
jgi:DNA replication and repair protein RecF